MGTNMPTAVDNLSILTQPGNALDMDVGPVEHGDLHDNVSAALLATEPMVVGPVWFNVKGYGAVGNGSTDDTAAIQAAIFAANTAGGGIVYFPKGTYLISATLDLNTPGVSLVGVNKFNSWGTINGSVITFASGFAGPVVAITANNCAVDGLAFTPTSGNSTASIVTFTGTSGVNLSGCALRNVAATHTGGVVGTWLTRSRFDNVVLQGFGGFAGFSMTDCSIIHMYSCNAAPVATGTSSGGPGAADYYILRGGSHVYTNCEANGTPYNSVWFIDLNDSWFWDMETNGATNDAFLVDGCNDLHLIHCYQNQTCVNGIELLNSCGHIFINGCWIGSYTGAAINSNGAVAHVVIDGNNFYTSVNPMINIAGNAFSWVITGNLFAGTGNAAVADASTNSGREMTFTGNTCGGTYTLSVTGTLSGSGAWAVSGNAGLVRVTGSTSPAVPLTTVAATNPNSQGCMVYINAAGATISAVKVDGVDTGLPSGLGSASVRVRFLGTIALTYTGGTPTWTWFSD
jgi:hypothetical protein